MTPSDKGQVSPPPSSRGELPALCFPSWRFLAFIDPVCRSRAAGQLGTFLVDLPTRRADSFHIDSGDNTTISPAARLSGDAKAGLAACSC